MSLSIKLNFNDVERRRFRTNLEGISFDQLMLRISEYFGSRISPAASLELYYRDDDHEWISFETEEEWQEAKHLAVEAESVLSVKIVAKTPSIFSSLPESLSTSLPSIPPLSQHIDVDKIHASVNDVVAEITEGLRDLKRDAEKYGVAIPNRVRQVLSQSRIRSFFSENQFQSLVQEVSAALTSASADVSQGFAEVQEMVMSSPIIARLQQQLRRASPCTGEASTEDEEEVEFTIDVDMDEDSVVVDVYPGQPTQDESASSSPRMVPQEEPVPSPPTIIDNIFNETLVHTPEIEEKAFFDDDNWSTLSDSGSIPTEFARVAPQPISPPAARFIRDMNFDDGDEIMSGSVFTKIWRLKNVGESAFPEGTHLKLLGDDGLSAPAIVPVPLVPSGKEFDVAVNLHAPACQGLLKASYQLTAPDGETFGPKFWVEVVVSEPVELKPYESSEEEEEEDIEDGSTVIVNSFSRYEQYAKQMKLLREMGFENDERNFELLEANNGDVVKVVVQLY